MPPAIEDYESPEESSDAEDVIPAKGQRTTKKKANATTTDQPMDDASEPDTKDDKDDQEDEDDEDAEDEYIVEKIVAHGFNDDGTVKYHVKWLGYEAESDRTWEPIENLLNSEALARYHKLNGKPVFKLTTPAAKGRGRGKRKSQPATDTPDQASTAKTKRQKLNGSAAKPQHDLPVGSWEDDIEAIITIEQVVGADKKNWHCTAEWRDRPTQKHSVITIRQKAPQKLLDFLLDRVTFTTNRPATAMSDSGEE